MTDTQNTDVPRPYDDPTPDAVYEEMSVGRCYVTADLVEAFDHLNPTRRTMQNRLDKLAEEGRIVRRKHTNNNVTYQRQAEDCATASTPEMEAN